MPKPIIVEAEVYSSEGDEFAYKIEVRLLSDGKVEIALGNDAAALTPPQVKQLRKALKKVNGDNK